MAETAKPSPQELAALEQAFAQDPTSEAYRPLAEAYLSLSRFMEAMVVAKKGAKARPTETAPRLVLARIYAEQGKDPRALEELQAALTLQPTDVAVLKLQSLLLFKGGQKGPASEALLKALAASPSDPEVAELMATHGVQPPPPPPKPVSAPPPLTIGRVPSVPPGANRVAQPLDASGQPMPRPSPRTQTMAQQVAHDLARLAEEEEFRAQQKKRGPGLWLTIGLAAVLVTVLAILLGYSRYRNKRDHEITNALKKVQEQLAHDSYASYQEAEKSAQHALELDPSSLAANAYLAYIDALRFGENGEGEDYLRRAQDYLQAAKTQNQPHAYVFAAEAFIQFYSQRPDQAEAGLTEILTRKDSQGGKQYTSSLLSGALGIIQLQEGKLGEARRNLMDAHNYQPADVRVTSALGVDDARLSSLGTAETFFEAALKVDQDHVPSLLGLTQLELDADPPDIAAADKVLSHLSALGAGALSPRQVAYAKFMHAQLLYAQGKTSQAAEEEKGAFALDPRNAEMLLVAGRRLRRTGQADRAIATIRQAIELDPNRGASYAELGEAYLAIPNGLPNAIAQLSQAVTRVPNNARLHSLLGEAYHRQGDMEHAQAEWQAALKIDPDNSDAHLGLARVYALKNDAAHARTEYELVARHAQGPTLAEADTELARAALDKGDANRARDLFTSALGASDKYAPPYFYFGKLLLADRGQKPKARALFQDYLRLAPDGPLAADAKRLMK